jgi:hypothetical protein
VIIFLVAMEGFREGSEGEGRPDKIRKKSTRRDGTADAGGEERNRATGIARSRGGMDDIHGERTGIGNERVNQKYERRP